MCDARGFEGVTVVLEVNLEVNREIGKKGRKGEREKGRKPTLEIGCLLKAVPLSALPISSLERS